MTGILKSVGPEIDRLPDPLLAKIFSYLPFKQRYELCLVSRRWKGASRVPWTDITRLSLNAIPRAMMNTILYLCPKISIIEATELTILLENKHNLSINENVRSMYLKNVKFALSNLARYDEVSASFHGHLERFPKLAELTLHNVTFPPVLSATDDGSFLDRTYYFPSSTAMSLQRLVYSQSASLHVSHVDIPTRRLANVQCLYVDDKYAQLLCGQFEMPQLRELCANGRDFTRLAEAVAEGKFPKLEVVIYASESSIKPTALSQLITAKSALRILAVAGRDIILAYKRRMRQLLDDSFDANQFPVTLPARESLPHQNSAIPSRAPPPLHIFVGGDFTRNVRFTLPPTDVAKFWRIDCPMPEYLAKPAVAEVFKGVQVAKIIREGPENGLKPWGHPDKTELFYSTEPLFFL